MNPQLAYEVRKPTNIDPNRKYPALFLMHGIGSNEQDMLSLVDGLENHFIIFSIRGRLSQPPGYAFFTIQGYGKPHREVFDQAINQVNNFIDYAVEQYQVDSNFLYLLGFSQGAIVSMTTGLTMGNRIKGIVALSGYIPCFVKEDYDIQSVENVSLFISHGEFDNILPYDWGIESYKYFDSLGSQVTFKPYQEGHRISPINKQDFTDWLLENLAETKEK
ncbi:phospholipase [Thalassobacillus devorans]|uniref:Phospholipase n=1 Tax=Thalassobacillus devorans TaxID=279813 RepID=A0ABQ1NL09_9BACI|nr:esterase [Thalassobacillus devorans]NIK27404.1 phospholipase/carboxylesterase [Thalassobacillus devorans]GGC77450.1 phospholipase [Thalassobacillus devorans]